MIGLTLAGFFDGLLGGFAAALGVAMVTLGTVLLRRLTHFLRERALLDDHRWSRLEGDVEGLKGDVGSLKDGHATLAAATEQLAQGQEMLHVRINTHMEQEIKERREDRAELLGWLSAVGVMRREDVQALRDWRAHGEAGATAAEALARRAGDGAGDVAVSRDGDLPGGEGRPNVA